MPLEHFGLGFKEESSIIHKALNGVGNWQES